MAIVDFLVNIDKLNKHIFDVKLTICGTNKQEFMLPNWIAGSYKIRDFAKHIININCENGIVEQISKNRFIANSKTQDMVLNYQVYAFDNSIRKAYLDDKRAFFNGSSIFLCPLGLEDANYQIKLNHPKNWQVATTLNKLKNNIYQSQNYSQLIDCPVEIADFQQIDFTLNDAKHTMAITGKHTSNYQTLSADLIKICSHHQNLFGSFPVDEYLFLTYATNNGYGGLEHFNSTALICDKKDLINNELNEDYIKFLGLCSHEYFHTWWIKQLKPKCFHNLDLEVENYTEQLWIFEGITSYYDDLSLLRAEIISPQQYLKVFSTTINRVLQAGGNLKQSIADASFNAWSELYQMDESTENYKANYYTKSSLVAFLIDIKIRKYSDNKLSLNDAVAKTYKDFAKTGLENDDFKQVLESLTGDIWQEFFADFVYGVKKLPLKEAFDFIGIQIEELPKIDLGIILIKNTIKRVKSDSCAEKYGLFVGDKIIAINQEKVQNTEEEIAKFNKNTTIKITVLRDNLLLEKDVVLDFLPTAKIKLSIKTDVSLDILNNQKLWFFN